MYDKSRTRVEKKINQLSKIINNIQKNMMWGMCNSFESQFTSKLSVLLISLKSRNLPRFMLI